MLCPRLSCGPEKDDENLNWARLDNIEKGGCSGISRSVHGFNLIFVLVYFALLCYFIEAVS